MNPLIRGVKPKVYRDMIEAALAAGWTVSMTGTNHLRLHPPKGDAGPVIFAAQSMGGGRGERNLRSLLRKRGVIC